MESMICVTCGTQYPPGNRAPESCPICLDERQYVPETGQQWTTWKELEEKGYRNEWKEEEPNLIGIGMRPTFAIRQRALLVRSEEGNVLWDCIPYLDAKTVERVKGMGGLKGIAISHPHFYSAMVEWAEIFDCPVYLHEADRKWVMRPDRRIRFWSGERMEWLPGMTLIRLGGHFEGSSVLWWRDGAGGKGSLLTGDTIYVTPDRMVTFMYSYPNLIPLPAREVERMAGVIRELEFDTLHAAWFGRSIRQRAKETTLRSAKRYVEALRR